MFVLDLDNFKPINDVYGHRLGDEVLKVISRRLTELADGGSVARLGGDEFGVTPAIPTSAAMPPSAWRARSFTRLSRPIQLAALSLQVGASVGVATCDKRGSGDTDLAMAVRDGAGAKPRCATPTWRCIGRRPMAAGATASSIAAWTRNCGSVSSWNRRSAARSR